MKITRIERRDTPDSSRVNERNEPDVPIDTEERVVLVEAKTHDTV